MSKIDLIGKQESFDKDTIEDLELDTLISMILGNVSGGCPHRPSLSYDVGNSITEYVWQLLGKPLQNLDFLNFRQEIYHDLFRSNERREEIKRATKNIFEFLGKEPSTSSYDSPEQIMNKVAKFYRSLAHMFADVIVTLDNTLSDVHSDGLKMVRQYASKVRNSQEFAVIPHDIETYIEHHFKSILSIKDKTALGLFSEANAKRFRIETEAVFFKEQQSLSDIAKQLLSYLSITDFLLAFESAGAKICRPHILPKEERRANIIDVYNPLLFNYNYMPTANHMIYHPNHNFFIITGPIDSGKTAYSQTFGLVQVLAQSGSFVPCRYAEISVVDNILTHFVKPNSTTGRSGRMISELKRCKARFNQITPYSIFLFDEPTNGVTTAESLELTKGLVREAYKSNACIFFVTHHTGIAYDFSNLGGVVNLHTVVEERDGNIIFTYRLEEGIADRTYALEIAAKNEVSPNDISVLVEERVRKGEFPRKFLREIPTRDHF